MKSKPEPNQWNRKLETETVCQLLDGDIGERNSVLGFARPFLCHLGKTFTNIFISMEDTAFNLCVKDAYLQKKGKRTMMLMLCLSCLFTLGLLLSIYSSALLEGVDWFYSLFAQH